MCIRMQNKENAVMFQNVQLQKAISYFFSPSLSVTAYFVHFSKSYI